MRQAAVMGATCALLFSTTGASAVAQERYDPDSPAGVEYQLPLDRAREEAADGTKGGGGSSQGGSTTFGEGISKAPGSSAAEASGRATGSSGAGGAVGQHRQSVQPRPGEARDPERADTREIQRALVGPGGDDASSTPALALGLALAVLGAGVGWGVRRRIRRTEG